mmetsp:Transcript_3932/g.11883  ORF Transcript_3932/g.11883 Transcript_3932/m.11883 type:complete len:258 (-) Transcript_3932:25-798(-)
MAQMGATGGTWSLFRGVVAREGWRGLFVGNLAHCVRVFPCGAITCTAYGRLLAMTDADDEFDAYEPLWRLGCGAAAAFLGNICTFPIDVVRARVIESSLSVRSAARGLLAAGGPSSFFVGLAPTLGAIVPFVAVQNTAIDIGRTHPLLAPDSEPSYGRIVCVGAAAGLAAQTATYPLDVLRRRLQAEGGAVGDVGWVAALRSIVRREGVGSLFAGIVPTYLKAVPTVAVIAGVTIPITGYFRRLNAANHKTAAAPGP